ncbi:MAG: CrcB family protein [Actinomycetaceae bacterium]|nr:CrcB family protein [Actinomycetaceae bacterium]
MILYWFALPLAGGLGAVGRYKTEAIITRFLAARDLMPTKNKRSLVNLSAQAWPILLVNIVGSFIAGLLVGPLASYPGLWLVVGVGFLGGWTTFSTALMDVLTISSNPNYAPQVRIPTGLFVAFMSMVICMLAALAGVVLTM